MTTQASPTPEINYEKLAAIEHDLRDLSAAVQTWARSDVRYTDPDLAADYEEMELLALLLARHIARLF